MTPLRLAYLALAVGLLAFGLPWTWLGLRGHEGPLSPSLRVVTATGIGLALVGLAAAVILEARAATPW